MRDLTRRFRSAIVALLLTFVVSVVGFLILGGGHEPLGQRLFMGFWNTLNLVSTVGSLPSELTPAERAWSMLIIIVGLGAVLYGFGVVQGLIHGGDVLRLYARRRMQRTLHDMSGHVIVCGFGATGRAVAHKVTRAGRDVVVIEISELTAAHADDHGFLVVQADATDEGALRAAGAERAAGIVATLSNDASNVYLALVARELNPNLRIVTRASRAEARSSLHRAGANRAIVPEEIAAEQLSHLILKPRVSEFVAAAIGEGEYDFGELAVSEHPVLSGRTLGALKLSEKAEVIVISVISEAGKQQFNPPADYELKPTDTLIVACHVGGLERLAELGI